ncbi:MAG TPA: nuclear transport factor 2 family protein [Tepidiformaceae bacterium]|nr:nuclear transport factor 2 family protein [Tepidiformaceae bacterium]
MSKQESLLKRAYVAFNARDIDGALALMQPDIDWPNAWEGGRALGKAAVRDYWTRQFAAIDPHVEPVAFEETAPGIVAVRVHQVVRDLSGTILSDGFVVHTYTIRDGLVERMDVSDDRR